MMHTSRSSSHSGENELFGETAEMVCVAAAEVCPDCANEVRAPAQSSNNTEADEPFECVDELLYDYEQLRCASEALEKKKVRLRRNAWGHCGVISAIKTAVLESDEFSNQLC